MTDHRDTKNRPKGARGRLPQRENDTKKYI